MPKSEFQNKGKKKHEIVFYKQQSRHPDKFLGVDLREFRKTITPQVDLEALKFQVGQTNLKHMPLSPDVRQYFKKPLYDHSINFDMQMWRPFASRPANMKDDDCQVKINDFDKGPKAQNEISDAAIG